MHITFFIGNGFDIASGIDTSYGTFYNWYCQQPSNKKHIERFKREIADDVRSGGKNWADFEIGLGKYTSRFTADNVSKFLDCYEDAQEKIIRFLELQKNEFDLDNIQEESLSFFKSGLLSFYQDLNPQEIKLFEELIEADKVNHSTVHFLSFNYTDTLDKVIGRLAQEPLKQWAVGTGIRKMSLDPTIIHIHGTSTEYPILGVDSPSQIANQDLLTVSNFTEVLVKPQSVNAIGELWHEQAQQLISKSKIIGIFGMSIGESDATWWNTVVRWLKENVTRHLIVFWYTKNPPNRISVFKKLSEIKKAKDTLCKYADLSPEEMKSISSRIHIAINTKTVFNLLLCKKEVSLGDAPTVSNEGQDGKTSSPLEKDESNAREPIGV